MQIFLWSLQITHPPASSCLQFLGENPGQSARVNDRWYHDLSEQTSLLANSSWKCPRELLIEPSSGPPNLFPYSVRPQGSLKVTGQGGIMRSCPVGTPRPAGLWAERVGIWQLLGA